MKKLLTSLALIAAACAPRWAAAEGVKYTDRDIVSFKQKASSDVALGVSSMGVVYNTEGLVSVREPFPFLIAPTTISILTVRVSTSQLAAAPTTYPNAATSIAQPQYPAVLWFNLDFEIGKTTHSLMSTATVSGIDSTGSSRTVRIKISSAGATSGVAFVRISSITYGIFSSTRPLDNVNATLTVGTTNQIGLANDITDDGLYAVWENNVLQTSVTYNAGYNTWTPNALPNYALVTSTYLVTEAGTSNKKTLNNYYELLYRAYQSPPRRLRPDRP